MDPALLPKNLPLPMFELCRKAFTRTIDLLAVRVQQRDASEFLKTLGDDLLNLPRIRNIVSPTMTDATTNGAPVRLVLLNRRHNDEALAELSAASKTLVASKSLGIERYQLVLGYEDYNTEEVFRAILPPDVPCQTAFEIVGHIAHMNLRDNLLPWKKLIGQVILDKNAIIRTVVNKLDSIDTKFRTFSMELLAGENDMLATVQESNCRFQFDFSKVYWNSRLHTEHSRIVSKFQRGDFVCDVFAGVGPFALPAAKNHGSIVYANDLNEHSYASLCENITRNKLSATVRPYQLDGREFIQQAVRDLHRDNKTWQAQLLEPSPPRAAKRKRPQDCSGEDVPAAHPAVDPVSAPEYICFKHFIMNLPSTAIDFLGKHEIYAI